MTQMFKKEKKTTKKEEKKIEYKPGDVLQIPKKYLSGVILSDKKIVSYDDVLEDFSIKLHQAKVDMWDLLLIVFPDIDEFDCEYDRVNHTVIIKNKTKDKLNIFKLMKMYKEMNKKIDL